MTSEIEIKEALLRFVSDKFYSKTLDVEFEIWDLANIDNLNLNYKIKEYIPGYFGIGSNGAGELLAVELSSGILYSIPFISLDSSEKIEVSRSITDLYL